MNPLLATHPAPWRIEIENDTIVTIFAANDLRVFSVTSPERNHALEDMFNLLVASLNDLQELKPNPITDAAEDSAGGEVLAIGYQNEMLIGHLGEEDDSNEIQCEAEDTTLTSVFAFIDVNKLRAHFLKNVDPLTP